jgi:hypothetical protein
MSAANKADKKPKVKVLYQNLGGVWYAFTNVGNDLYFSPVNLKQSAKGTKKAPAKTRTSETKLEKDAA